MKSSPALVEDLVRLLRAATGLLGIKLCFRVHYERIRLPREWGEHVTPACLFWKDYHLGTCCNFDGFETDRALMGNPQGRIQTCPRGFTEIAVPVLFEGRSVGTLFGGPCWVQKSPRPDRSLVLVKSHTWLEERHLLLQAVAGQLGDLIRRHQNALPQKRSAAILGYVTACLQHPADIHELAARLNLSKSRTAHLVQELFGMSLPLLAREVKLQEAARELLFTDLPVSEVARRYGFPDAAYFSRVFTRKFQMPPRNYRSAYQMSV